MKIKHVHPCLYLRQVFTNHHPETPGVHEMKTKLLYISYPDCTRPISILLIPRQKINHFLQNVNAGDGRQLLYEGQNKQSLYLSIY